MVKCPECGKINLDNSKFCSNCGSELAMNKFMCPNCGKLFSNNEKFCTECGNKLIFENQRNINRLYEKAKKSYDKKDFYKTIKYCNEIIKLDSNNEFIWYLKGKSNSNMENYKNAIECYEECLKINPTNQEVLKNIGISYQNLEDYNNALNYYNKFLDLNYKKYIFEKKLLCEKILKEKEKLEKEKLQAEINLEDKIENISIDENLEYLDKTNKEVYFSKNNYVTAIYSINNDGTLTFSKYEYNISDDDLLTSYCEHQLIENDYNSYFISNNYIYLMSDDYEEQYSIEEILNKLHTLLFECELYEHINWIENNR